MKKKAVVSGGELSHNSLHPLHQEQPQQLSSKEQPLHKHPRSSLHRSVELQEAKSQELTHVLSTACVYDLPDLAWKDPACVFRGHLLQGQLSAKKSGQKMTNKLAARHRTRSSKSQVDIGADSSTALHTVVSVGSPASFGGASLGASMVHPLLPSPSAASDLAYDESLKENEEAETKTNLPLLSPVPSLDLDQLELQPVVASLSSRQKSLQQTELEAAYPAKKSLTAFTEQLCFKAKYQLGQTKARELELSRAQLCRPESAETSLQLASSSLTLNRLSFMAQFQASPTRASLLRKSLWQLTLRASWLNIFEPESSTRASRITAAGKLQVAGDLRNPESIHYVPLPQTMQSYLAIDVHDMYMDLRNVAQNNLAGKGLETAEAEELRYENVFPNLTTGSVDLVVKAETSYHPKRPANNGVKGEVGSIIMAVWAILPFSLWPGMGVNAYFAYTTVGFKGQSNPVKKVLFAVAIESVIFIVMSSLDIRRMIFKIFPAWMMKAMMARIGMFVAFIGLQSGKGIDIIKDHPAVLVDLVEVEEQKMLAKHLAELGDLGKMRKNRRRQLGEQLKKVQYQLGSDNNKEKNFDKHNNFHKWLRELEKYCEELTKSIDDGKSKVHSKFRSAQLAKVHYKLRNENEKNNELEKNFNNTAARASTKQLSIELVGSISQTKGKDSSLTAASEAVLQRVPQIQLCRDSFQQMARQEPFRTSSFQEAACSSSLSTKTLDSNNFQDSSLTEETFSKTTSQTAAWQKRARTELQTSTFSDSSLAEESFRQATSQTAAWQKKPSERHLQRQQLGRRDLQHSSFKASSLEKALCLSTFEESSFEQSSFEENSLEDSSFQDSSLEDSSFSDNSLATQLGTAQLSRTSRTELVQLQRRTLTTELSEPERTALHTELAELERPTLTTELAQLKTSSFGESSFDSLDSPASEKAASTAQLCFTEANFSFLLGGPSSKTSRRRGGVLNTQLASSA